ncbi:MAG: hypothetical protein IJL89_02465 [Firmicutes bacterium]|nr:hypothetical protein [Bacillota bacterium]
MTYFNPDIYNYDKLHDKEKTYIDGYDAAVDELDTAFTHFMDDEDETVIGKMRYEIWDEVKENVLEYLAHSRVAQIVSIMDNDESYDEE